MSDDAPDIEKLRKLYYKKLLGTATLDELWRQVKKKKLGFKLREVKAFLKRQRGATLAKEFKRPKKFSSIISKGTGMNWQADLMFIRREKGKVKANKFSQPLLNIVDVHSRFAWSVVIKDKKKDTVAKAFEAIVDKFGAPKHLNTDEGKEFLNSEFKAVLQQHNIKHWVSEYVKDAKGKKLSEQFAKNAIVERFNRTLRGKMKRFKKNFPSEKVIDSIDRLMEIYNNRVHRTTGRAPRKIWEGKKRSKQKIDTITYGFQVGDQVRVLKKSDYFAKGTYEFDEGLYNIYKIKKRKHYVRDPKGKKVKGSFMGYMLQKVEGDETAPDFDAKKAKKADKKEAKKDKESKMIKTMNKEGISDTEILTTKKKRVRKGRELVGKQVQVAFAFDDPMTKDVAGMAASLPPNFDPEYYKGIIISFNATTGRHMIRYEYDGKVMSINVDRKQDGDYIADKYLRPKNWRDEPAFNMTPYQSAATG